MNYKHTTMQQAATLTLLILNSSITYGKLEYMLVHCKQYMSCSHTSKKPLLNLVIIPLVCSERRRVEGRGCSCVLLPPLLPTLAALWQVDGGSWSPLSSPADFENEVERDVKQNSCFVAVCARNIYYHQRVMTYNSHGHQCFRIILVHCRRPKCAG